LDESFWGGKNVAKDMLFKMDEVEFLVASRLANFFPIEGQTVGTPENNHQSKNSFCAA